MSRPTRYNEPRVSSAMRLPRSLHERLVEAARERQMPVNWMVQYAITEFLDRLIPASEIKWTRDE